MSMLQQIAKLLSIREDQVDGALRSDPDARRFLSRRGLVLGAIGAATGAIVGPSAPLVQVTETLVKKVIIEASWAGVLPGSLGAALYMQYRHRDGSVVTWKETP